MTFQVDFLHIPQVFIENLQGKAHFGKACSTSAMTMGTLYSARL